MIKFEIAVRDSIKLNILREVMAGKIKLAFSLNKSPSQDYASEIHSEQSRVKVYGNFNISEDPTGEILTIRVVTIGAPLRISLSILDTLSGKNISLFRGATKSIESTNELTNRTQAIEFIPGQESYTVVIHEKPADPLQLQSELDEIKSRVEADEEILSHYDAQDVQEIFNEIKPKLSQAEDKLRSLIAAREEDTKRIESATR